MNAAKPKTRDRILASARELFFSKGLDETSIAEICKHSGVSNGSLFHHFPTKEAIALEIFVGIRRHYWEHVIAAMEAESTVPAAAEASVRAAFAAGAGETALVWRAGFAPRVERLGAEDALSNVQWDGPPPIS